MDNLKAGSGNLLSFSPCATRAIFLSYNLECHSLGLSSSLHPGLGLVKGLGLGLGLVKICFVVGFVFGFFVMFCFVC